VTRGEEASTTGFGEYLRREREMRGVSLEEISAATRISIRFLEAIEGGELSKLPGGIFTRSFVRTYARYLGLDEDRVLADCQLAGKPKTEVDIRRIAANRARSDGGALRTRLIGLGVAAVLLAGGYALFHHSRRVREQSATTPLAIPPSAPASGTTQTAGAPTGTSPSANPASGQLPAPALPQSNTSQTPPASSPAGPTPPQGTTLGGPPPAGDKTHPANQGAHALGAVPALSDLSLQVASTERAWVAVDADGKTVLQRVLNPNEVENLKAHDSFDVTVGNASGIVLTLNGETLKPLGRRGEVKSVHLTRESLTNSALER